MRVTSITITHLSGSRAGESETCAVWPVTIGRAPANIVKLGMYDTRASAKHAILKVEESSVLLEDVGSTNGTFLRGQRLMRMSLADGDVVEFGVGGPQLRFNFALTPVPETQRIPATAPAASPLLPVYTRVEPAAPARNAIAAGWAGNAPSETSHMGTREFPLRGRFRALYYIAGFALLIAGGALFASNVLVAVPPTFLLGVFSLLIGWSQSRVNITITPTKIEYQGVWRQFVIPIAEVKRLRAAPNQTRLLNRLTYTVESDKRRLSFATEAYKGGLELAQLLTRRTGKKWESDG